MKLNLITRADGTVTGTWSEDTAPPASTTSDTSANQPAPTSNQNPAPATTGAAPFPGWPVVLSPSALTQTGYGQGAFDASNPQTYAFSTAANVIHSHRLRFDAANFPGKGAVIQHNQFTLNANPRDVWISAAPGGPKVGVSAMQVGSSLGSLMRIAFDNSGNFMNGITNVTKGAPYYLNVKAHDANVPVDYLISASAQP